MKKVQVLQVSIIIWFATITIGALLKILHRPYSDVLLAIGMLALLVFLVSALVEVYQSTRINNAEKWMWFIGLIFLPGIGIAGIFYLLVGRKNVVAKTDFVTKL